MVLNSICTLPQFVVGESAGMGAPSSVNDLRAARSEHNLTPISAFFPSQNGLLSAAPRRHKAVRLRCHAIRPLPYVTVTSPQKDPERMVRSAYGCFSILVCNLDAAWLHLSKHLNFHPEHPGQLTALTNVRWRADDKRA